MRRLGPALIVSALLSGVSWSQPGEGRLSPVKPCPSLRSLTAYEFSVVSATVVPADNARPEHCLVTGQILPEVRFKLYLPTEWNERFYMHGNGGYAGNFPRIPGYLTSRLQQGFAVAMTDTGHDAVTEPLASFSGNHQKLLDFAFRAVHVTTISAKEITRAYYGRPHRRAYFEGCSTGGRQGLILAQRFPDDFDGIVAGAPILSETGQRISQAWMAKALAACPLPRAKLPLLAEHVYARCDEKDGLKDGLIDDPRRCDFSPSRDLPRCGESGDTPVCFTPAEIQTLEKIYADVTGGGRRIYPGLPVGGEKANSSGRCGWDDWIVGGETPTTAIQFAGSFFKHMAFPQSDPGFELADFDFNEDPKRMSWIEGILNATDTDLSTYERRGGKILMYFGWADAAVNPLSGVEYYEDVCRRMGDSTRDFFRLFMVPGMFHCVGGVGPNLFDKLGPLMNWVENGVAPARIMASQNDRNGKVLRTRPLCPYPQVARFRGSGNVDDAASFECVPPTGPEIPGQLTR